MDWVPFNKPYMVGKELWYIAQAHHNGYLAGDGEFTERCQSWLEARMGNQRALLTHSCTAALEMAAILTDIQPGDEIIMPSFTFVSTANAFVLRGGVPVFVDIRADTLNINEALIEQAITPRTKAIVPIHYAGVGCEMDTILEIAFKHDLFVIEDAAQGLMSSYKNRPLGAIGHLGALSFHETKNIISGEGGALLVNDPELTERAEIIWEKGTNRKKFFRGEVDKYSWVDVGSSFLPSELVAAFLWAQMEEADTITNRRLSLWRSYHKAFTNLESRGWIKRPCVPQNISHNAHMYYVLLHDEMERNWLMEKLATAGIHTVFHYIPLHSSPAGKKYGRTASGMEVTDSTSRRILRLPLWVGLDATQNKIIGLIQEFLEKYHSNGSN